MTPAIVVLAFAVGFILGGLFTLCGMVLGAVLEHQRVATSSEERRP